MGFTKMKKKFASARNQPQGVTQKLGNQENRNYTL